MTRFINLTPHDIVIFRDGKRKLIPATGKVARVSARCKQITDVDGIPVMQNVYGEVEGLPDPEANTIYIVSSLVACRAQRVDVLVPNDFVRDDSGRIIGCRSLALGGD